MTDVLDRLRADNPVKAGAAPSIDRVWARLQQNPHPGRRWPRTPRRAAAATVSILIPVVIAALAVGLLGHDRHPGPTASPPAHARPTDRAVPTLAQLLANFAVLRRAQTGTDRSWRPDVAANTRSVARFTRLARRLPNGDRIFLDIQRFTRAPHGPPAGSYTLEITLVTPNGTGFSTNFGANVNYTVVPLSSFGLPGAQTPKVATWASIIPDGVAYVRWRFGCPPGNAGRCGRQGPVLVTVPVRGNVAATSVPGTSETCSRSSSQCRTPVAVTWYANNGRVVARYSRFSELHLRLPPFIKTNPTAPAP